MQLIVSTVIMTPVSRAWSGPGGAVRGSCFDWSGGAWRAAGCLFRAYLMVAGAVALALLSCSECCRARLSSPLARELAAAAAAAELRLAAPGDCGHRAAPCCTCLPPPLPLPPFPFSAPPRQQPHRPATRLPRRSRSAWPCWRCPRPSRCRCPAATPTSRSTPRPSRTGGRAAGRSGPQRAAAGSSGQQRAAGQLPAALCPRQHARSPSAAQRNRASPACRTLPPPPTPPLGRPRYMFICVAVGLWGGLLIGLVTEYFTSNRYKPVQVGGPPSLSSLRQELAPERWRRAPAPRWACPFASAACTRRRAPLPRLPRPPCPRLPSS
jgi:hypothetical protein